MFGDMKENLKFVGKVALALLVVNLVAGFVPIIGQIISNPLGTVKGMFGGNKA